MNLRAGDKSLGLTNAPRIGSRFGRIPPIPALLVGRESALLELKNRLGIIGKIGKCRPHQFFKEQNFTPRTQSKEWKLSLTKRL